MIYFDKSQDCGDLTAAKALREKLECKSFKWYMNEIIPDLIKYYPPEVLPSGAWGQLRNVKSNKCIDPNTTGDRVIVVSCPISGHALDLQVCSLLSVLINNWFIKLTWNEDIRPGQTAESTKKKCMDASYRSNEVMIWTCHNQHGNQVSH